MKPLITVRTAVVLLLAMAAGLVAGGLSWWAGQPAPAVVVFGIAMTAEAVLFFNQIIGD